MTPQQIKAMKLALEALKKCHYYMIDAGLPNQSLLNEGFTAYKALEEVLAEHAMREVQRLGQEIEEIEYCTVYHCAGDCGQPHNQEEMSEFFAVQPEQEPVAVYGYCPECGAKGVMRERRPNGNDKCANGHTYPSSTSTPPQRTEQEPVAIKRMKEWVAYLKRKSDHGQHMKIPSEMSAGACWELAIELEQFINTHPPQRTEQAPAVYSSFGLMGGDAFVSGDSLKRNIT